MVIHTKFVIIDHQIVRLTSANFSYNAENRNIEFGLSIRDNGLARSIESTMTSKRSCQELWMGVGVGLRSVV